MRELSERTPAALVHAGLYDGPQPVEYWAGEALGDVSARLAALALGAKVTRSWCGMPWSFGVALAQWVLVRCQNTVTATKSVLPRRKVHQLRSTEMQPVTPGGSGKSSRPSALSRGSRDSAGTEAL